MTDSADELEIDGLIARFFECFDNDSGPPKLHELTELCTPDARVAKAGGPLESLAQFIRPRLALLSDGRVAQFRERETSSSTFIVDDCAQRTATYEKRWVEAGHHINGTGHKFFHLVCTDDGWKIISLLWQDD
jgi:hypothetical protein